MPSRCRAAAPRRTPAPDGAPRSRRALLPPHGSAFLLVAAAFAAYAFVPSALSAHLLAIFGRTGIDAATVVLIGALFGPAQVAARLTEFVFGRNLHPLDRWRASRWRCWSRPSRCWRCSAFRRRSPPPSR